MKSQTLRFIYSAVGHPQETQLLCSSHEATHERHYHPTAKISHEKRRRAGGWMDGHPPPDADDFSIFKNFVGSRKPNRSRWLRFCAAALFSSCNICPLQSFWSFSRSQMLFCLPFLGLCFPPGCHTALLRLHGNNCFAVRLWLIVRFRTPPGTSGTQSVTSFQNKVITFVVKAVVIVVS